MRFERAWSTTICRPAASARAAWGSLNAWLRSAAAGCWHSRPMAGAASGQRILPHLPRTPLPGTLAARLIPLSDVTLKSSMNEFQVVTVRGDPLFGGPLQVQGYSLDALLRRALPDLPERLARGDTLSLLRRSGPAVRLPLRELYGKGAVIATAEVNAPSAESWRAATWEGHSLSPADIGFYLVWMPGTDEESPERPWVWGLTSLIVLPPR